MAGCKCLLCRAANARYECARAEQRRAGLWNGIVSARRVRRYLRKLSRAGIGYKQAAKNAGVAKTTLAEVLRGTRRQLRALTEKRVLEFGARAVADGGLTDAAATWRRIGWLLDEGFTKREIARRLGSKAKTPALQIHRGFVTGRTLRKVEALWRSFQ
jgi:hypothetical protein